METLFEKKSKAINRLIIIVGLMQIIALCITCPICMILTTKGLYMELIWLIPFHALMLFGIIKFNAKKCKEIENMGNKCTCLKEGPTKANLKCGCGTPRPPVQPAPQNLNLIK